MIHAFQLMYMLCDSGLADKQFLRGFGETQVFRYAVKHFKTEIGHGEN